MSSGEQIPSEDYVALELYNTRSTGTDGQSRDYLDQIRTLLLQPFVERACDNGCEIGPGHAEETLE